MPINASTAAPCVVAERTSPANSRAEDQAQGPIGKFQQRSYFPEIDGIRGVAASMVITAHVGISFLSGGYGVSIFFALSGFLITTLALREEDRSGRICLKSFYIRRCFRIFPIYFLVLGLHFAWLFLLGRGRAVDQAIMAEYWPHYVFYFQEFIPAAVLAKHGYGDLLAQSWSLGIEEKFYLLWPVLCFVFLKTRKHFRSWVAIGLSGVFALSIFGYERMFFGYHMILLGCFVALILNGPNASWIAQILVRKWIFASLTAVLVFLQLFTFKSGFLLAFYAPVFSAFMASLILGESWLKRLLSSSGFVFLGRISYGIYLVHLVAIKIIGKIGLENILASHGLNLVLNFCTVLLISIALASVLHFTVEKPLIKFGRKLAQKVSSKYESNHKPVPEPAAPLA
jgi:peptidoglycan/LPS O-acetylase OafA/YrhL